MNRTEHLLNRLSSECAEVTHAVSKALDFGLDDRYTEDPTGPPATEGPTNRERIVKEFTDIIGAYRMLVDEGILPDLELKTGSLDVLDAINAKKAKIRAWMPYAEARGTLQPEPQ